MSMQARSQAINPAASFLVQAPAGSGKTELLTQRILKLLAVVDGPEEILALTFTRKAAAEMRGRVIEALAMQKPDDPDSHKMQTWQLAQAARARSEECGWHVEQYPARLRMMTMDSFTHALASQMPLLSGFGDIPHPCNHPFPLYREAAESAVNSLIHRNRDQAGALLLHQDHNAVALIGLLAEMLGKRDQWLRDVEEHAGDLAGLRLALENSLATIMQQTLQQCFELLPSAARAELPALIVFAANNRGDEALQDLQAWPEAVLEQLPAWQRLAAELMTGKNLRKPGGINARRGFPAGKEFAAQKTQFQSWLEKLADVPGLEESLAGLMLLPEEPCFSDSQWQVLEALFTLLGMANTQLQRLFEQRGEADFIEIALRAMRALEDGEGRPTDLLLKLDYRIRHVLVDEFQDTSLLQIRLLQCLTAGWQAGDGSDRSLFMVGDPMQSIYRFRKAEVGLFLLAAANRAGLPDVEKLTLERNFRSSPAIVAWVNRAFADILPREPDIMLGAVEYAAAQPALSHPGLVRLHVQQEKNEAQEAAAIVAAVREQLARQTDSGETPRIAILARFRKHLHAIMPALSEAGIPFRAIDILPLNNRPEIRQMRALLRALLHPADRESWAALLRGPCCGLSTQELHILLAGDLRPVPSILGDTAVCARLDAAIQARIEHLKVALAPCLRMAGRVAVRRLLETAWQRMGMASLMGRDEAGNIDALLGLVSELDEAGSIRFSLLDERLEKLFAAPDSSPQAAQVDLLTMHGAKGLQWDVVILPGLGRTGPRGDMPLLAFADVPVQGGAHPLIAVRAAVRRKDAVYDLIRKVESDREANELARLLYVACTRAETSLLMFGHVAEKSGQATAGSLFKMLLPEGVDGDGYAAEKVLLESEQAESSANRLVLHRIKVLPELSDSLEEDDDAIAEYFWAGPEAAPIGTALHAALQLVAEQGSESWQADDTERAQRLMRRELVMQGLSGKVLEGALDTVARGLDIALGSERGRWILSAGHQDAHCEWSLCEGAAGRMKTRVIDRSFIDASGIRWIVDYKTGTHEGADLDDFLAGERERYRAQLEDYARLIFSRDKQRYPIRLALYFPMLDAWEEWQAPEVGDA